MNNFQWVLFTPRIFYTFSPHDDEATTARFSGTQSERSSMNCWLQDYRRTLFGQLESDWRPTLCTCEYSKEKIINSFGRWYLTYPTTAINYSPQASRQGSKMQRVTNAEKTAEFLKRLKMEAHGSFTAIWSSPMWRLDAPQTHGGSGIKNRSPPAILCSSRVEEEERTKRNRDVCCRDPGRSQSSSLGKKLSEVRQEIARFALTNVESVLWFGRVFWPPRVHERVLDVFAEERSVIER